MNVGAVAGISAYFTVGLILCGACLHAGSVVGGKGGDDDGFEYVVVGVIGIVLWPIFVLIGVGYEAAAWGHARRMRLEKEAKLLADGEEELERIIKEEGL